MGGKTLKEAAAAKLGNAFVVQGITVENVTADTINDFEFMEAIATLMDETADDSAKLRATANIAPVIFGAKQWKRIKGELREQNEGRLTAQTVMGFIDGVLSELNSKN